MRVALGTCPSAIGLQRNGVQFVISSIPEARMGEFYDRLAALVPAATVDRPPRTATFSSYDESATLGLR